jgi:23S rRNA pseudouridine1911/1915/1917 synthase
MKDDSWTVPPAEGGTALAAFLRARLGGLPWTQVKRLVGSGKVSVDGSVVTEDGHRVTAGATVALRMSSRRPDEPGQASVRLVHEDLHLVVIDKPSGISSVPYDDKEQGTALDLVRAAWRKLGRPATSTPLFTVHRIDKETSGLLVFAKTKRAERGLAMQFRTHAVERMYLCVAHGDVKAARIESMLVEDRGDGLRGSTRFPNQGKRAVTHVTPRHRLPGATLCEVRLETGKTHQIRIHLSERGHPLVGERVYIRDFQGEPIVAPRLYLHAATLGFVHPVTGAELRFESPLPPDFPQ